MSNFFNGARFTRLWNAHWSESWREYAWFAGIVAMLDLICIAISFTTEHGKTYRTFHFDGQVQWYVAGLFVSATVFAGRYFKNMVNPGASLLALMRPASIFEKWLLAFMLIGILFPLTYTLGYCLLNYPAVQLAKTLYDASVCENCSAVPDPDFGFYIPFLTVELSQAGKAGAAIFFKMQVYSMLLLSTLQASIAGGTVFFKRSPVLRTLLLLFVIAILLTWTGSTPQLSIFLSHHDELIHHGLVEHGLSIALWLGLPALLWLAVFFHLKEREVS